MDNILYIHFFGSKQNSKRTSKNFTAFERAENVANRPYNSI